MLVFFLMLYYLEQLRNDWIIDEEEFFYGIIGDNKWKQNSGIYI